MAGPFKVLIFGIDSFTGIHLKNYFIEKGYHVYGTDLTATRTDVFKVDILNKKRIIEILTTLQPNYVINLAGISFVGEPNKELFYKVNSLGTEILLEAILESGVNINKVIMPSSAVVYGTQATTTLDESLIPNPNNHYGYSKFVSEQICKTFFNKLNIIVTRPFNYTGLYQNESFLIPKIVHSFKINDNKIALGNLYTLREYNNVRFICEVYEKLLNSSAKSDIINVCSGSTHSVNEIVEILRSLSGIDIRIDVDKRFIRENEIMELKGSPEKLVSFIGDCQKNYSLEKTLSEMYSN